MCLAIGKLSPEKITLSAVARSRFYSWFNEHYNNIDGPAGSWAKMDGYCARIACVLHHLSWAYGDTTKDIPKEVDVSSVLGAIKVIDYFKNHCRRALGAMAAGRKANKLSRVMALVIGAPDFTVWPRQLISAQIAANRQEADELLSQLARCGMGTVRTGNRKDEVKFVGNSNLAQMVKPFESPDTVETEET